MGKREPKCGLTVQQTNVCHLLAEGRSVQEIALLAFDCTNEDGSRNESRYRAALRKINIWQDRADFQQEYRRYVQRRAQPIYGKAMSVIDQQMGHDNPWVAQGAAREALNRFGSQIMGSDDRTVTVRIEGAPELGTPDQDES